MPIFCTKCKAPLPEACNYCPTCGACQIPAATRKTLTQDGHCKACYAELPATAVFCPACGTQQHHSAKNTRKRANGTGTIVDFGERAALRYGARVTAGFVDGKQLYQYIGRWRTKTEARTYLDMYNVGQYTPPSDLTLVEIYEEWSKGHFGHISKKLQENYASAFQKLNAIHNKRFVDLRTAHYQEIIDGLALSESSKRKIKVLVGLLYKYAMENDICQKNYAQFIKIDKAEKKEKEIFSDAEIAALWHARPASDSILVLLYTGFRIQEMLNLQKSDIDMDHMLITGGLKTDAGKHRIVPIHPQIQPIIRKLYHHATDLLFTKEDGTPITANYYRKYLYYPLLEQLQISRKSPHSTRHTFASLLARVGADTNDIKNLIGHSSYAFTADVYTHVNIDTLRQAIQRIPFSR